MNNTDITALIDLARLIPSGGTAVEIGSRFGGSAKAMLDHAKDLQALWCFEPEWKGQVTPDLGTPVNYLLHKSWHAEIMRSHSVHDYAAQLLAPYPNVHLISQSSPQETGWWQSPIDLLFEDSTHQDPQLRQCLDFWEPFVKPGGIIAGHDYHPGWPDVQKQADALARRLGNPLYVQGTVWWVQKPWPPRPYSAYMGAGGVEAMKQLASLLPADAICAEIGSKFGGSALIMLTHAQSIKRFYCIDQSWVNPRLRDDKKRHLAGDNRYSRDWFHQVEKRITAFDYAKGLLAAHANARLLPGASPDDFTWWQEPLDFVFEDAWHRNPNLRENLDFWSARVKSGGIIAGHDHDSDNPDVLAETAALADWLGAELRSSSGVWWMIKP